MTQTLQLPPTRQTQQVPERHLHRQVRLAPRASRVPTYLRVEVTTRCPLRCDFCHAEGNGAASGSRELPARELITAIEAMLTTGVRKVKFLGGEPLVRKDLPDIVKATRSAAPNVDLSMITSGVGLPSRLDALFAAGLDRANLSIHGFELDAFRERGGNPKMLISRQRNLETLLALGRPVKLNYVYRGPRDDHDLSRLLDFAATRPVVVGLLDELGDPLAGPHTILAALTRLRGASDRQRVMPDPDSLDTTELSWGDGLRVEVKTSQLGRVAPWRECVRCPARDRCREGIFAVRLTPEGWLQPCMDRPDWRFPLHAWIADGAEVAGARVRDALSEVRS